MIRRQFLTYTLGGTGGFLASVALYPMVRFAVDPLKQAEAGSQFVDLGPVDQFDEKHKFVRFFVKTKGRLAHAQRGFSVCCLGAEEPGRGNPRPLSGLQACGLHGEVGGESPVQERVLLPVPRRPV